MWELSPSVMTASTLKNIEEKKPFWETAQDLIETQSWFSVQ